MWLWVDDDFNGCNLAILTFHRQLDRIHSFLESIMARNTPIVSLVSNENRPFCTVASAVYWHCLRQDCTWAWQEKRKLRFDMECSRLWQTTKLPLANPSSSIENEISRRLIWILSSIINFVADNDRKCTNESSGVQSTETPSNHLPESWNDLSEALEAWHQSLPPSFIPYVQYQPKNQMGIAIGTSTLPFPEILFARPVVAMTMQYFHSASVLLLLSRPPHHGTHTSRLQSYRQVVKGIEKHCVEICGIATARPRSGVRIYAVQPLFLAGQCFEDPEKREGTVQLLQEIEFDLGWPTSSLVEKLHEEWNESALHPSGG
jgi:hypothetical protein